MARRCHRPIGASSQIFVPAAPPPSVDQFGVAVTAGMKSSPIIPAKTEAAASATLCHYFHVTVTVPEELRSLLRTNQRDGYAMLMKAAADAIIDIARDTRFVGGTVGVRAVLHTWTQQLLYHPHVHCLVTGGGASADGRHWYPASKSFLAPAMALAKLVRGKLKALLANKRPDLKIPDIVWTKSWVVKITRWGEG